MRDDAPIAEVARPPLARVTLDPRIAAAAESVAVPLLALLAALLLFGVFIALCRVDPLAAYGLMYKGAFGSWFSWQNSLVRAAPLLLTALCTALPAQVGLVVIGGEGALVMGGLAAVGAALALPAAPPLAVQLAMAAAGMAAGGAWIALAGALRQYRGVNETISSLLLVYIALAILNHLVEGPMRDPASLNKPSSPGIGELNMIGAIPGTEVHWGLVFGIAAALLAWVFVYRTSWGFAARVIGGKSAPPRWSGCRCAGSSSSSAAWAAPQRGSPAWSRWPRCKAAPMRRSRSAMASPESSSPSSRATTRSPSSRSRSCSAASARAAGCCSAASGSPTQRCWCCRG
jgi:general nucleoside transport system permease protein